MTSKITVIGEGDVVTSLTGEDGRVPVTHLREAAGELLAGSDVVVVAAGVDVAGAARAAARRASGSVLLVATGAGERDCTTALSASLLPRSRVLAVEPADVVAAVAAVVDGRDTPLEAWAYCRGELGIDDRVAQVPVVLGAGGLRRIGRED
jgi:hypothetical protein